MCMGGAGWGKVAAIYCGFTVLFLAVQKGEAYSTMCSQRGHYPCSRLYLFWQIGFREVKSSLLFLIHTKLLGIGMWVGAWQRVCELRVSFGDGMKGCCMLERKEG